MLDGLPTLVPHRIGNWCEEMVLKENQLREFLGKSTRNELICQRVERRIRGSRRPVKLSDVMEYDQNIMLKNLHTEGFLSIDVPDNYPDSVTNQDTFNLTTSLVEGVPVARNCFRFLLKDEYRTGNPEEDKKLRYGQKFYLVLNREFVQGEMYLSSTLKTLSSFSKYGKQQPAYVSFHKSNAALWKIDCIDPNIRFEMEGQLIEPGSPVLITHCVTGQHLSSDPRHIVRNDFSVEWEAACHSYKNLDAACRNRQELVQNHWVIFVGQDSAQSSDAGAVAESASAAV
ncbi:uncharacterized protein BJ171DRAFT_221809 [Polychytrium aggregatum]|uniref:uncharacterized protein n=1 Tax=Polychytrium aggregatum TaxID=110093 RepID=UPI0022FE5880|nr:uncharacterized protein BJ171DRAFT_221809 [Polychytrium aggregatum]KAI9197505.1 hypothetical protein BJ171DRAFT_221809 [Polychytrium aggregatum]